MEIKFKISEIKSLSDFLDIIENRILKKRLSFILLENDTGEKDIRKLIREIKNHFDIFILEISDFPKLKSRIDESFFNGFHGVYFKSIKDISSIDMEIIDHAIKLFPKGSLFMDYNGSEISQVDKILERELIPVSTNCDPILLNYIKEKVNENGTLSRYLKYVPLLDETVCSYHIGHKLKRKLVLESYNLRQRLMVKSVEDSFNSSKL